MDARAVGVFDSGMGGLTVLHECLVTMPHEDFVYLGDAARLPYGPRPLAEVKIFAREFGRDVTLVFSAEETAREVAETLARKGIENDTTRDGAYRFLTTGDPSSFKNMGARFLQLPIATVDHVAVADLEAAA